MHNVAGAKQKTEWSEFSQDASTHQGAGGNYWERYGHPHVATSRRQHRPECQGLTTWARE